MLITDKYRKLNEQLHRTRKGYGTSSGKWVQKVIELSERYNTQNVLDYGCGKGRLQQGLPFQITQYDPAIPEHSDHPTDTHDIVVCTDVLEHIEPDCIDAVLDDIANLTNKVVLLTVATRRANKTLADGRNAHLIIKNKDWWLKKVEERFTILEQFGNEREYTIIGIKK